MSASSIWRTPAALAWLVAIAAPLCYPPSSVASGDLPAGRPSASRAQRTPSGRKADPKVQAGHLNPRAPSGPPLLSVGTVGGYASTPNEASASAPPSAGDVLAANGLNSPLCRSIAELPATVRRSCGTAGFTASADPTGDYAFDVNINTGLGDISNDASVVIQDFSEHAWMALVVVTHALIVMLVKLGL